MGEIGNKRTARGPIPGAKVLSAVLRKVAGPALRRRGFFEASLVTDWPAVVGEYLAAHCVPEKLTFPRGRAAEAVLELRADSAFALELQHLEPQILERINGHFGFAAVGRLKIVQGPMPMPPAPPPASRALAPEEEEALESQLASVKPEGLRAALKRLGRAVRTAGSESESAPRKSP